MYFSLINVAHDMDSHTEFIDPKNLPKIYPIGRVFNASTERIGGGFRYVSAPSLYSVLTTTIS